MTTHFVKKTSYFKKEKNASNYKLSQKNEKFIEKVTGGGFKLLLNE